jgi:predicted alpha/beta superfamily hydrolase
LLNVEEVDAGLAGSSAAGSLRLPIARFLDARRLAHKPSRAAQAMDSLPGASYPPAPMYQTVQHLRRPVHVLYPVDDGELVLRTELDWDRDVEPVAVSPDGQRHEFVLEAARPFLYFKPCLRRCGEITWASGPNVLALLTTDEIRQVYPFFAAGMSGSISDVLVVDSRVLGRPHLIRAYLPPGYGENPLKRYPVLYMQDGKNLFFPEEAFLSVEWEVDESLGLLDSMNAADTCVVIGIHSHDRMTEYTKPGYEAYGRSLVEEIKPSVDANFRTLPERQETGVMGSSLGGVVSFYMGWQYPDVFGYAASLSATFSHKDDLIDRVLTEPRRETRFYLDSGWPGDNYEVTLAMAMAFTERGYVMGRDFVHFAFPLEEHSERAWAHRLHLPVQLFSGKIATATRGRWF